VRLTEKLSEEANRKWPLTSHDPVRSRSWPQYV